MNLQDLIAKITGFETQLTDSNNRIKALETDLATQTERANSFEASVSDLTTKLTEVQAQKEELSQQAEEAKAKADSLKSENTELKGKLEDPKGTIQTEASKKAQTIISQTGTPPVETDEKEEGSAHGESIAQQYQAITDNSERLKFFQKHHKELNEALAGVLN